MYFIIILLLIGMLGILYLLENKVGNVKTKKTKFDKETAQQYMNIKKFENGILYTEDNHIVALFKVEPVNINLLSELEIRSLIRSTTGHMSEIKFEYNLVASSKPADISLFEEALEDIKEGLDKHNEVDAIKIELIKEEIDFVNKDLISSKVIEREFYFYINQKYSEKNLQTDIETLNEKINIFNEAFDNSKIKLDRVETIVDFVEAYKIILNSEAIERDENNDVTENITILNI